MATTLTLEQMKQFVRNHFEDFVNKRNAAVIHSNMTPEFYDHDGPGGKPAGADVDEKMMLAMYPIHAGSAPDGGRDDRRRRQGRLPQYLALDRRGVRQKDAVSRVRPLAFRRKQDRGALGHCHAASRGQHVV